MRRAVAIFYWAFELPPSFKQFPWSWPMKLLHCFVNTRLPWASHARRVQDDKISHSTCSTSRPVTSVAVSLFCASLPSAPIVSCSCKHTNRLGIDSCDAGVWLSAASRGAAHSWTLFRKVSLSSHTWSPPTLLRLLSSWRETNQGDTNAATICRLHTLILLTHWCQWSCCNLLTLGGKKKERHT